MAQVADRAGYLFGRIVRDMCVVYGVFYTAFRLYASIDLVW